MDILFKAALWIKELCIIMMLLKGGCLYFPTGSCGGYFSHVPSALIASRPIVPVTSACLTVHQPHILLFFMSRLAQVPVWNLQIVWFEISFFHAKSWLVYISWRNGFHQRAWCRKSGHRAPIVPACGCWAWLSPYYLGAGHHWAVECYVKPVLQYWWLTKRPPKKLLRNTCCEY